MVKQGFSTFSRRITFLNSVNSSENSLNPRIRAFWIPDNVSDIFFVVLIQKIVTVWGEKSNCLVKTDQWRHMSLSCLDKKERWPVAHSGLPWPGLLRTHIDSFPAPTHTHSISHWQQGVFILPVNQHRICSFHNWLTHDSGPGGLKWDRLSQQRPTPG